MDKVLLDLLNRGACALSIKLNNRQITQLLDFTSLLIKWNKAYNLTAITRPEDIIIKHILDSLSILPFVNNNRLLDIGTGAGLPGLVLAIAKPNLEFDLLDSRLKKCHFLQIVRNELNLENLTIINSRIENYRDKKCFGQISSRAFADIDKTVNLTKHLLCAGGHYLLMKSDKFFKEKKQIKIKLTVHNLVVPFLKQKRYLVQFSI